MEGKTRPRTAGVAASLKADFPDYLRPGGWKAFQDYLKDAAKAGVVHFEGTPTGGQWVALESKFKWTGDR